MFTLLYYHERIQEFSSGWGGGPGQTDKKKLFFFLALSLFYRFQRNRSFFKVPEGVQHFPGEVQLFPGGGGGGGPIETHITCDFPGGVQTPCPPSGSALDYHIYGVFTVFHQISAHAL